MQCHYNTVIDGAGNGVNGAAVSVYKPDLVTLATIYSDNGVTTTSNPIICDSLGRFSFFAGNGVYALKISGAGIVTYWIKGVSLFDPSIIYPWTPLTLNAPWVSVYQIPSAIRVGDIVSICGTMKGNNSSSYFSTLPALCKPLIPNLTFPIINYTTKNSANIALLGGDGSLLYVDGNFLATDILSFGFSYTGYNIV